MRSRYEGILDHQNRRSSKAKLDAEGTSLPRRRVYLYLTPEHIYAADHIRDTDAGLFLTRVETFAIINNGGVHGPVVQIACFMIEINALGNGPSIYWLSLADFI